MQKPEPFSQSGSRFSEGGVRTTQFRPGGRGADDAVHRSSLPRLRNRRGRAHLVGAAPGRHNSSGVAPSSSITGMGQPDVAASGERFVGLSVTPGHRPLAG